ncbi:uncharacterized protein TNCV_2954681 [Trichonephila clavipes]|nr:uncharacterized protein TNCV_2954681 [Trichonephila clavipes]
MKCAAQLEVRFLEIWILTDSRASIQHLANWGDIGDQTSLDILSLLHDLSSGHSIHFQWIPSHVGIEGNERADFLARTAAEEGVSPRGNLTFSEISTISKLELNRQIKTPPPQSCMFTCRNCGGGDRGRVAIYRPFGEVSLSLNRTVTCMVLKANDRRTSCPCHDEFRGSRSDYVRQDKYGEFLSPLIDSCLPEDILLAFERSKNFKEDTPGESQSLKLLMNFLKQEVKNDEMVELARNNFSTPVNQKKKEVNKPDKFPSAATLVSTHDKNGTGGRRTVRKMWNACVKCRRFKSKSPMTDPVSLPSDRVKDAAVFEVLGVDLAGPLYVKQGDKVWIVFYTCAIYRALHLEFVSSLSTDAFLLSFRRFVARRGRPRIIYSDNGTNIRGAYNELIYIDWNEVSRYAEIQRITCKFIPPSAAWWGGLSESLVRTVKELFRRTLGKAIFTYEELLTILCECEKVVNSRPLTYLSEDMQDLTPITPEMFLFQIPTADTKDLDVRDANHFRKRLRFRAKLIEE